MDSRIERINEMEKLFDRVLQTQSAFEKAVEEYRELQEDVHRLEEYYASQQWKDDLAADEKGEIPKSVKRGVLSEDGIFDMLERNKEIMEMIRE